MASERPLSEELFEVEEAPPELPIREYVALIKKRRVLIAACIGLSVAVATAMALLSPPYYRAVAVLAVEKDRGGTLGMTPADGGGYDPDFIPTQIRLMKSREIAARVVKRLKLTEHPAFQPPPRGLFGRKAKAKPAPQALPASQELKVALLAQGVRGGIEVQQVRATNVVELSYVATSPQLAADIANAAAEAYIEWHREAKFEPIGEASQFLTGQAQQIRSELDVKERQLLAYGRQKDIVSSEPGANAPLQNLESLNADYAGAVADRVAKEAKYHSLRSGRADAAADNLSFGLVSQLRGDQARLEREYAEKLNVFKPEWPAMQQLKAQIDKGRQNLDATIRESIDKAREVARSEYETALRREGSLKSVLQAQKGEAMRYTSNSVEYNNLRAEVDTKKALLANLTKGQEEAAVAMRMKGERSSNVRIVDRALPPLSRFKPSRKQNLMVGLAVGSLLGVGLAFLLAYLDRSLRTGEEVEQHLHLPALGLIPAAGAAAGGAYYARRLLRRKPAEGAEDGTAIELLPHHQPRSRIAESYRAFRTALLLSRAGGVKSIVITSSFPGEGKTATALNLAVVLGQLGKRVLLVDADLHRPHLHEILRVSNRVGLVSVLAENFEPSRVIMKTEIPDVFLVPAGPSSPNPSGLLASDAMRRFMELAAMNFEYLVLDAPPVAPVADALLLGSQVDGVIVCVRAGKTPREQVAKVRDKLLRSNVKILGVLLNALDASEGPEAYPYDQAYYAPAVERLEERPAAPAARSL